MKATVEFNHQNQQWQAVVKDKGRIVWKSSITYKEYDEADFEAKQKCKQILKGE